jgi:hypothetical protein
MTSSVARESQTTKSISGRPDGSEAITSSFHFWTSCTMGINLHALHRKLDERQTFSAVLWNKGRKDRNWGALNAGLMTFR